MGCDVLIHLDFGDMSRFNPWLGELLDPPGLSFPPSGSDLMKRVYGAHTASRVLDPQGRISDIVNNLAWCSFSFEPEQYLLFQSAAPNVYQRILDADRLSLLRLGKGNAVATGFSGGILPLFPLETIRLDIALGLEFFRRIFQRQPTGFFSREMAMSNAVADVLIEQGVRYTFVSPWQIQAVSVEGSGQWRAMGPYPYQGPSVLRLKRKRGILHLIVYDHDLHQAIEQGHVLHLSHRLEEQIRLRAEALGSPVVATHRAEHFGFWEPYADMCLADLIHRTCSANELRWTNGDTLVESCPDTLLAKLRWGEGELGTSWSCSHGLARWYRSCGCRAQSEPHWNQDWRAPLKELLHGNLLLLQETVLRVLDCTPEQTAGTILETILPQTPGSPGIDDEARRLGTGLLYALKSVHHSAWFYGDPVQAPTFRALGYGLRALELLEPWLPKGSRERFLDRVAELPSNLPEWNGKRIVNALLLEERKDCWAVAGSVILGGLQNVSPNWSGRGHWEASRVHIESVTEEAGRKSIRGALALRDRIASRDHEMRFEFREDIHAGLSLVLSDTTSGQEREFDFRSLSGEERTSLTRWMARELLRRLAPDDSENYERLKQLIAWHRFLGASPPLFAIHLVQEVLLERLLKLDTTLESWATWETELSFAKTHHLSIDRQPLLHHLSRLIGSIVSAPDSLNDPTKVQKMEQILARARHWGLEPDLTIPQNILWSQIKWWGMVFERQGSRSMEREKRRHSLLRQSAELLGFSPEISSCGCEPS